ncbi:alpha/beta hydrolase [Novipirellula artificiosorum]|uniref:Alpha/beta hydrolase family protein n=1 Tax=Novipirellula artificiosorum TaxID=2528016 RepID=A0A5C6DMA5_9BACT|nr:alpha/beta fold hydrolase [Novipirellula artificiosorum]TWU35989.1 Alpha/beta hydrolase family protein [Novipirellula artificiosorum]
MLHRPIHRFRSYLLDRLVLRPTRDWVDHGAQERVMLSTSGGPLETFLHRPLGPHRDDSTESADLLILKFPGTAGRAERSTPFPAESLDRRRVHVWTWNPPGYGRSAGRATLGGIADASVDFYQQVTERYRNALPPIWLCGNSLGCVTALHVAAVAEQPPAGLMLRNPPPIDQVVRRVAAAYPLGRLIDPVVDQLASSMNALHTAPRVHVPAVFLQSERDTLVPPEMQQRIRAVYGGPQRLVPLRGLSHDGLIDEEHQASIRGAIAWLCQQNGLSILTT